MTAQAATGVGPGSSEGPLRGFDLDNIRRVYIDQNGELLPCVFLTDETGPHTGKWVLRAVGDGQIKIDASDEISGYFADKIIPGTGVVFVTSPGPNKTVTINTTVDDHKVFVDGADIIAGFLDTKILAGTNITFATSVGPNKAITINSVGQPILISATSYSCPVSVAVNDAVYITIVDDTVDRANATSFATAPIVGFVISKPTATTCMVAYAGEVPGFVGLLAGEQYYLDIVNGAITLVVPSSPGNIVQRVGTARNSTTLVVGLDNYTEL
jgi:hypothetical protein